MAKIIQTRRGSVEQHIGFDGQQGEVTFDLTANTLRVHDGSTFPADQPSGYPLARADLSNVFNAVGIQQLNLPEGTPGQFLTTDGAGTISFASINTSDDGTFDLGGDLSGTINAAEINANTISGIELDIAVPPTDGRLLTIDSTGVLGFIIPQTEFILAGDVNGPLGNNLLSTNIVATNNLIDLSVTSPKLADGAVTKSKMANNAVNISELDVNDGNAGQILSTNGNGELLFINNTTTVAGSSSFIEDIFQGDGTTTDFTVSVDIPSVVTVLVYIDGVSQPTSSYSAPTARTLRFQENGVSTPPLSGSTIRVVHLGIVDTGNASVGGDLTGTIANAQIIPNVVGIPELNVADGNAGEFLRTNGAGLLEFAAASGGGGLTGMQVFDTPGAYTWTKPSDDVKSILYFVTGGGQSGVSGTSNGTGDGGRSSSTVMGFLDVSNITNENGVVGAGGAGSNSVASSGQDSTFGTHATAAANGSGTGGQVRMEGVAVDTLFPNATAGGRGAISFWGGGPGSGGRGGNQAPPGGFSNVSSDGQDGIVVILEFGGPEETTGSGSSTASVRGSLASYTTGGELTSTETDTVDKFAYASENNIVTVGSLQVIGIHTSCQSATDAYSMYYGATGQSVGVTHGVISKISFSNDTVAATDGGSPAQTHVNGTTAHSSETNGYWAGGNATEPGQGQRISKFSFANNTETTVLSTLLTGHGGGVAGASDFSTGGYVWGNFPNISSIDKFSFVSDTNSTGHGDLAEAQRDMTGQSGETHAYTCCGFNGAAFRTAIDKFAYASNVTATNVASIGIMQLASGTASTFGNGYVAGGNLTGGFGSPVTGKQSVIRRNSHTNDTDAIDVGNLSSARSHFGGCGACV